MWRARHALLLAVVGCACVATLPDALQTPWVVVPVNGWTVVHLVATCGIVLVGRATRAQLWAMVLGWEVLENACVGRYVDARFAETWGDVLGDLLVAIPASMLVTRPAPRAASFADA